MKTFERRVGRESLDGRVISAARAYGFTSQPLTLTRPRGDADSAADHGTALVTTLIDRVGPLTGTTQMWGTAKKSGTTSIVFVIGSRKIAVAQTFVVKAALAVAESSGLSDLSVHISSVGDAESRRRYLREVGNFFKRYAKDIPEPVLSLSVKYPDRAISELLASNSPLEEHIPRTIDYLSEPSRKIILETISLFERLGIRYELNARLPFTPDVNHELVFAIYGTDKKGQAIAIASGGRFVAPQKKKDSPDVMGMHVAVPQTVDCRRDQKNSALPACFVVHVGEAAKLKAFTLLDSLWRSEVHLDQALLEESIQAQMQRAQQSQAKYLAIIGQREALDNTVIVKNVLSELQEIVPLDKVASRMSRVRV